MHRVTQRYDNPAAALINALCKGALEQLLNHFGQRTPSEERCEGKKLVRMSQLDCFLKFPLTALVAIASMSSPNKNQLPMKNRHDTILFWGCFIAIVTTSYAFISRMILCGGQFVTDFGLDKVSVGELQGAGIWPFGVSIIVFSLFIDRIGYKVAMVFSFVTYLIYTALALAAYNIGPGVISGYARSSSPLPAVSRAYVRNVFDAARSFRAERL
jgi:hypothetical protein